MRTPRTRRLELELPIVLQHLVATGEGAPSTADKIKLLRSFRGRSDETDKQLDEFLIREASVLRAAVLEAQESQQKLQRLVEKLTAPPWHPAVFLGSTLTSKGEAAIVHHGTTRRVVRIADEVDLSSFSPGDEILLGPELNVIVAESFVHSPRDGETAVFDRLTPDGRVVLRHRDEEIVVVPGGAFDSTQINPGDCVRWDSSLRMAFEKIERSKGEHLFLEQTPQQTFADIGGLDPAIERLKRWIWLQREHAEAARRYGHRPARGVILVGPPGNGKTMLARAFANYLADVSSSGRSRFMSIPPSALHSMWYGQSEANYREAFRVAREIGDAEPDVPVVMFFDEVDAIGAARGNALAHVHDRILPAFMNELDGLDPRGNVIVLAATNRADALDPALTRPDRLGDDFIHVPRPNRKAAAAIFAKYLHSGIPIDPGDNDREGAEEPRTALIDSVVSRVFSQNGESALATLRFRDGKEHTVRAADLLSGAVISKIVNDACERACIREIEVGQIGVRLTDLLSAVDNEFDRVLRFLTPVNCRRHLDDLPQDVDVVALQPAERGVQRPQRYLRIA